MMRKPIVDLIPGDVTPDGIVAEVATVKTVVYVTFVCGCVVHGSPRQDIDVVVNVNDLI